MSSINDPQQASDLVERVRECITPELLRREEGRDTFTLADAIARAAIAALTPARSAQTSELVERLLWYATMDEIDLEKMPINFTDDMEEAAATIKALEDEVERLKEDAATFDEAEGFWKSEWADQRARAEAAEAALATARETLEWYAGSSYGDGGEFAEETLCELSNKGSK